MRRLLRGAVAALALASAAPASALALAAADDGLTPAERAASAAVLAQSQARVPPHWAAALGALVVEWRDDLPPHVAGRYVRGRVRLQRALLHDPQPDTALAALLHELAHAWDRSAAGGLSRDPRLLDLAGWSASPSRFGRRLRHSDFRDRSPDAYELASPAEFVAVNLEHVLLDADYGCRRPALARWFAQRAGIAAPAAPCAPPVFVQPAADAPLLEIDPARVYAVDYLLAEPDAHPMSRWGHSMLRLVVCAQGRPPGPACRLDLDSHVVLSFRAFVDDVQISGWRGLTGGYPSRLFVLPLSQVVDEYTKVELRGLRAEPLRLTRAEIAALLERAAQVHWSYDGRYRFVGRNCAVETWRLLHDAVPRIASARVASRTPTGLLRRLERAGFADRSALDDADAARRHGLRFDSMGAHYRRLFDGVRASLPIATTRVDAWLDLPPDARAPWIDRADLRTSAALLVLENAAVRRAELRAADALKRRFGRAGAAEVRAGAGDMRHIEGDARDAASGVRGIEAGARDAADRERRASAGIRDAVRDALDTAARLARPAAFADTGYGLPQPAERERLRERATATTDAWRSQQTALRNAAEAALAPDERAALVGARRNMDALGERVRRLARREESPQGAMR